MGTYQIEIIDPKAKALLGDLANQNLITIHPLEPKKLFKRLLDTMRSAGDDVPSLEEIAKEVDLVRLERYAARIK
jgi:hypothetical protein